MRRAARYDNQIAFGDLKGLAGINAWAAPFPGLDLAGRVKFSTQRQRRGTFQHIVNIVGGVM